MNYQKMLVGIHVITGVTFDSETQMLEDYLIVNKISE